jgi:hypothetical protein
VVQDSLSLALDILCTQCTGYCKVVQKDIRYQMMLYKEFFSAIAIALTFIAFFPYILSILKDETKPHVFSWVTWGSTTFIVFLAQLKGGGGVGAWPIGLSGLITIVVAILAYLKKSDKTITLNLDSAVEHRFIAAPLASGQGATCS